MQVYFGKTKVTARENTQKRLFPAINQGNRKDKTVKYDHLNQLSDSFLSRSMSSKSKRKHGPLNLLFCIFIILACAQMQLASRKFDQTTRLQRLFLSIPPSIILSAVVLRCNTVQLIDSLHSFSITPSPVAEEFHEICFAHRIL